MQACGLRRSVPGDCGMIVSRVAAAALLDLRPAGRLAGAASPLHRVQGRRTARATPRGRRAAPDQAQAAAGLGGPGDPGRVDPMAAEDGEEPPARHPGDDLALASPPGRAEVDLPEPHRAPARAGGGRRADRAAGQGQSLVGIPAPPGRAAKARSSGRRLDHPPDPESGPGYRRRRPAAAISTGGGSSASKRRRRSLSTSSTWTP